MRDMFNKHNLRPTDEFGSGEYGASRGDRTHNGTDFVAAANEPVYSPVAGTVTKLGYPYADDLSYRYIEVTESSGYKVRLFYVSPSVQVGASVALRTRLGSVQSLQKRYDGIIDHVHLEVKKGNDFISWEHSGLRQWT